MLDVGASWCGSLQHGVVPHLKHRLRSVQRNPKISSFGVINDGETPQQVQEVFRRTSATLAGFA